MESFGAQPSIFPLLLPLLFNLLKRGLTDTVSRVLHEWLKSNVNTRLHHRLMNSAWLINWLVVFISSHTWRVSSHFYTTVLIWQYYIQINWTKLKKEYQNKKQTNTQKLQNIQHIYNLILSLSYYYTSTDLRGGEEHIWNFYKFYL